jgi:electron transfer flavoprotein beta subunit
VSLALQKIVEEEKPDLILMGKQTVDGDSNQVGQRLAELLDYPMATFAATIHEEDGGLLVSREVDGGVCVVRLKLPALVTVDLRIVAPTSVYSLKTDRAHQYNDGVRFAPLPAIMQAKRKKLDVKSLGDLLSDVGLRSNYRDFEPPPQRQAGARVADVAELVDKLANVAKVI